MFVGGMTMKKLILGAVAAMAVGVAQAQVYVGAGLTVNRINLDCTGMVQCKTDAGGGKIYAGYVPKGSGLGAEIAYLQLGKAKTTSNVVTNVEASGVAAAMVLRANLTPNFWLHAKLGAAQVSTSASWYTDAGQTSSPSESIMRPYYSFGMDFGLVENVKLMAYADWTKGKYKGKSASMHMTGLGVEFLF